MCSPFDGPGYGALPRRGRRWRLDVCWRFDCGNYRSEPPGSLGSRVAARVIDAGVVRGAVRATVFMGVPLTLVFLACHASALNLDTLAAVYGIGFPAVCAALWLTLPARRGLHDLASGTVVVSTQGMNRLAGRLTV